MAERTLPRVQLRRGCNLLAQIRRSVDQEPVVAIRTDGDGGLGALQLGLRIARRATLRTPAIPLRNTAAGRCSENDDTQHRSAPGQISSKNTRCRALRDVAGQKAHFAPSLSSNAWESHRVRHAAGASASSAKTPDSKQQFAYLRAAQAYMLI